MQQLLHSVVKLCARATSVKELIQEEIGIFNLQVVVLAFNRIFEFTIIFRELTLCKLVIDETVNFQRNTNLASEHCQRNQLFNCTLHAHVHRTRHVEEQKHTVVLTVRHNRVTSEQIFADLVRPQTIDIETTSLSNSRTSKLRCLTTHFEFLNHQVDILLIVCAKFVVNFSRIRFRISRVITITNRNPDAINYLVHRNDIVRRFYDGQVTVNIRTRLVVDQFVFTIAEVFVGFGDRIFVVIGFFLETL